MTFVPSGEQIEIASGDWRATVVEVGGGLRTLSVGGRDVLDGFTLEEMCSAGRGQLLLPWPNRIEDGKYVFQSATLQLPLSEPGLHNAIHGLTRWVDWKVLERDDAEVTMGYALRPQPGYPFGLDLSVRFGLTAEGLTVTIQARNVGDGPCPFGAGAHPYVTTGSPTVDVDSLAVPASTYLVANNRQIPTQSRPVDRSDMDYRRSRQIASAVLDTCYTDLQRDNYGRARVRLSRPAGGGVTVWTDEQFPYVMIFSGDTVHPESRRRQGLAVEPMTCAPNAFNSGDGLIVLEPDDTFRGSWGISAE
jgi:aldose 1-epimerase